MPPTRAALILIRANRGRGEHSDADDYDVSDGNRVVGRIMLHPQAPEGHPWFWSITARAPQSFADRGYAASREQAMADFKAQWLREVLACHRIVDLPTPNTPSFMARCGHCNSQIWVGISSRREARYVCFKCAADYAIPNQ